MSCFIYSFFAHSLSSFLFILFLNFFCRLCLSLLSLSSFFLSCYVFFLYISTPLTLPPLPPFLLFSLVYSVLHFLLLSLFLFLYSNSPLSLCISPSPFFSLHPLSSFQFLLHVYALLILYFQFKDNLYLCFPFFNFNSPFHVMSFICPSASFQLSLACISLSLFFFSFFIFFVFHQVCMAGNFFPFVYSLSHLLYIILLLSPSFVFHSLPYAYFLLFYFLFSSYLIKYVGNLFFPSSTFSCIFSISFYSFVSLLLSPFTPLLTYTFFHS